MSITGEAKFRNIQVDVCFDKLKSSVVVYDEQWNIANIFHVGTLQKINDVVSDQRHKPTFRIRGCS